LLTLATATLIVGGGVAALARRPPPPIERARKLVADDRGFVTARESGLTLIAVARLLRDSAESCRRRTPTSSTCADLFAGTAYAQVSAVRVLRCTRPGVFDTRKRMREYLDGLHAGTQPRVPDVVVC
jgi:hypothetical protein